MGKKKHEAPQQVLGVTVLIHQRPIQPVKCPLVLIKALGGFILTHLYVQLQVS